MVIQEAIRKSNMKIGTRDTSLLFRSVLNKTPLELLLLKNTELPADKEQKIHECIERILSGEPLQYVVGSTEFMSLEFEVNPSVLIPRSDTECLVEEIIKNTPPEPKILDIGTGSGCIAVSLAYYIKGAEVSAIDKSITALETARRNAEKNNVKINLIHHDIMCDFTGSFDIVVSNPPYIETEIIKTLDTSVRDFEPHSALDGGRDGLDFYRRIIHMSTDLLKRGGSLYFETGHTQAQSVASFMRPQFTDISIINDLCGIPRVVSGKYK